MNNENIKTQVSTKSGKTYTPSSTVMEMMSKEEVMEVVNGLFKKCELVYTLEKSSAYGGCFYNIYAYGEIPVEVASLEVDFQNARIEECKKEYELRKEIGAEF